MKLRVHSWGGLGSQLFALALIYEIRNQFPKKKIILVHHTSGISRRLFELHSILEPNITLKLTDDYKPDGGINKTKNKIITKHLFIKTIKRVLERLNIFINIDQNPDINGIKPWTTIIRGHYNGRFISNNFLSYCIEKFTNNYSQFHSETLIIHYRLGDLIELPDKSIITPEHVLEKIRKILELDNLGQILVYSDTISEARKLLSPVKNLSESVQFLDDSTFILVQNAISSKYFIGTNSKVSIWISMFRGYRNLHTELLLN
jgi:hypothetical protein